jgi:2-polyprenyl-3-methyl-5-hydroxy-6-metoxy-1,4-benzoquinol methylase
VPDLGHAHVPGRSVIDDARARGAYSRTVDDIQERFDALRPWYTRYTIGEKSYGGDASYDGDVRVGVFFTWFDRPKTILELGSLEGGDSLQLAAPDFVERVVAVEARAGNIARAKLAAEYLGRGNIEFRQADLERALLDPFGRFDAVFCGGLLYHLMRPWHLLEEIGKVTDQLFLDTQISATEETTFEGYTGSWYAEQPDSPGRHTETDVLSGLSDASFWLALPCLVDTLARIGLVVKEQRVAEDWDGYGPRVQLAAIRA